MAEEAINMDNVLLCNSQISYQRRPPAKPVLHSNGKPNPLSGILGFFHGCQFTRLCLEISNLKSSHAKGVERQGMELYLKFTDPGGNGSGKTVNIQINS